MHEKYDLCCDDSFAFAFVDCWSIVVVCDGAGSAKNGAAGASFFSNGIVENLRKAIGSKSRAPSLRSLVHHAIADVRNKLVTNIDGDDDHIANYHTTVVGAICRGNHGLFFHIGDGAASCFRYLEGTTGSWIESGFSPPAKSEFAEVTVFVTSDSWEQHLVFARIGSTDAVCLLTDGVTPFALVNGETGPDPEFFNGVNRFMDSHHALEGARSLRKLLDSAECRKATFDDKTLVWFSGKSRQSD